MMRALVITNAQVEAIERVRKYAEAHPTTFAELQEIGAGRRPPPGDAAEFRCEIPVGYRCVFTYEEQAIGLCRHLSVSVDTPQRWPSIEAVQMLMGAFGFQGRVEEAIVWKEGIAINVLEPITAPSTETPQ